MKLRLAQVSDSKWKAVGGFEPALVWGEAASLLRELPIVLRDGHLPVNKFYDFPIIINSHTGWNLIQLWTFS